MTVEEYNWLDDAFDESKPDPLAKSSDAPKDAEYDWIDDAFDESKEDPLSKKGMTGCSRLAVLLGVIGVIVVMAVFAIVVLTPVGAIVLGSSPQ